MSILLDNIQPSEKNIHTAHFYKQPVYRQLALECQIAKQLSGLNITNYRIKKSGVFPLY